MKEATDKYKAVYPTYVQFTQRLDDLLKGLLEAENIKYDKIEARAKTIDSFEEKISRPGKTYSDPLSEITDLSGLRVILYYSEDVEKVIKLLKREFKINETLSVDKKSELKPDQLGYISTHLIVSLNADRKKLIEWKAFEKITAEIQIRTVLQHAWASISHALQYKNENEVPIPFRRKLLRLSGIMELADEQFSELREEKIKLGKALVKKLDKKEYDILIDKLSVKEYLLSSDNADKIIDIAIKHGFGLSGDSFENSQLVNISAEIGVKSISEIDIGLSAALKDADTFFKAFATEGLLSKMEVSGGKDHWCAVLFLAYNIDRVDRSDIKMWGSPYVDSVFKVAKKIYSQHKS